MEWSGVDTRIRPCGIRNTRRKTEERVPVYLYKWPDEDIVAMVAENDLGVDK